MNQTPPPKPEDFKTIRLSGERRDALMAHARAALYTPAEEAAELAAHEALVAAVMHVAAASIPRSDLDVLRRYKHTKPVGTAIIADMPVLEVDAAGTVTETGRRQKVVFCFCPRDVRAVQTSSRSGCHRKGIEVPEHMLVDVPVSWTSQEGTYNAAGDYVNVSGLDIGDMPNRDEIVAQLRPAVLAFLTAKAKTDAAREAVTRPLYSVVHRASTLQAVAEVWPEAMRLAEKFEGVRLADEAGAARIAQATFAPPAK